MKGSVSIALFFLLSGFFLTVLLGAIERSGKLLAVAGGCLAGIVCIIVFLSPVQFPSWHLGGGGHSNATVSSTTSSTVNSTSTARDVTVTTEASGAESR